MRKIISILISTLMIFSVVGCSGKSELEKLEEKAETVTHEWLVEQQEKAYKNIHSVEDIQNKIIKVDLTIRDFDGYGFQAECKYKNPNSYGPVIGTIFVRLVDTSVLKDMAVGDVVTVIGTLEIKDGYWQFINEAYIVNSN